MYSCVHVCTYTYLSGWVCGHVCVYSYVHMCEYLSGRMCTRVHVCVRVCVCTYVYVLEWVNVCVCTRGCVYMYVCIRTRVGGRVWVRVPRLNLTSTTTKWRGTPQYTIVVSTSTGLRSPSPVSSPLDRSDNNHCCVFQVSNNNPIFF